MIITFCGHSEISTSESLRKWLQNTVSELIRQGADTFYLGDYGDFDRLSASVVREMKTIHPQIISVLVIPYLDRKVNTEEYDCTTYPPLELVPRRFAISKRNEWMIDQSDVVVAYVTHDWGGAAATLSYAVRKKKIIRNYADEKR